MIAEEPEVTAWMKSRGFSKAETPSGIGYFFKRGVVTTWETYDSSASEYCYNLGETRTDADGAVLNELGESAKLGDVILRGSTGFPVQKFGTAKIDLKKVEEKDEH